MIVDDDRAINYIHAKRIAGLTYANLIPEFREKFPQYAQHCDDWVRKQYNLAAKERGMPPVDANITRKKAAIETGKYYYFKDKDNPWNYPPRAYKLHHLDLVREGHDPDITELRVCPRTDRVLPKNAIIKPNPVRLKEPKQEPVKPEPVKVVNPIIYHKNKTPDELMMAGAYDHRVPINTIFRQVCVELNVSAAVMKCRSHKRKYTYARFMVFWLSKQAGYSLVQIARKFDFDHTSVLYGVRKFEKHIAEEGELHEVALRLRDGLIASRPAPYWGA